MALFGLGPAEIILIVAFIIILIVGPKKIPELFRSFGKSFGEFKKGMKEEKDEEEEEGKKSTKKKKKEDKRREIIVFLFKQKTA